MLRLMFFGASVAFIGIFFILENNPVLVPSSEQSGILLNEGSSGHVSSAELGSNTFMIAAALWMFYRFVSCASWAASAKLVAPELDAAVSDSDEKGTSETVPRRDDQAHEQKPPQRSANSSASKPFFSFLGIASKSGTIVGMLLLGYLMRFTSASKIWLITGLVMLLWATNLMRKGVLRETAVGGGKEKVNPPNGNQANESPTSPRTRSPHPLANATTSEAIMYFLSSPRVYQVSLFMSCTTILTELQSHFPTILMDLLDVDASNAAIASAAYSAGYVTFVLIAGFVYGPLSQTQRAYFLFAHYFLGVAALFWFAFVSITSVYQAAFTVFLMGGFAPTYYIPYSPFCLKHGGKYSGTLMGMLDTVSFGSTVVMHACIRGFAATHGWDQTFVTLFGVSCVGLVGIGSYAFARDTEV